ncbi:MAG: hypothetical protein RLZZ628_3039 [Bacteroidota bacterium]|jgi:hypothetical protein
MKSILKLSVCFLFFGRAYQHWFADAPYRDFVWDENLMQRVTHLLGMQWSTYTFYANIFVFWLQKIIGIFFLTSGIIVIFAEKLPRLTRILCQIAIGWLFLLAFLYQKDHFYQIGQLLEYALQIATPLIFIQAMENRISNTFVNIVIALTFSCHGLYASGYYAVPVGFVEMTLNVFHCSEIYAKIFLKIMGFLDFAASIALFFPKTRAIGLIYCILWGFLTAIARPYAYIQLDLGIVKSLYWLSEAMYRVPHFGIPLYYFVKIKTRFHKLFL